MKENKLQLVTFEQAKALKELGFDWETYYCYTRFDSDDNVELEKEPDVDFFNYNYSSGYAGNESFSAPEVALAIKWFRDVKGDKSEVVYTDYYYHGFFDLNNHKVLHSTKHYDTYEKAESALLDDLIKMCKREAE